jgi:hypothetical protein
MISTVTNKGQARWRIIDSNPRIFSRGQASAQIG